MKLLMLFIFTLSFLVQARLDPHGKKEWDLYKLTPPGHKECLICHKFEMNVWRVGRDVVNRCTDCHNEMPHSGLIEHKSKKINCLTCHRAHRASVNGEKVVREHGPSQLVRPRDEIMSIKDGYHFKNSHKPMLKKNCLDCHKWSSLP